MVGRKALSAVRMWLLTAGLACVIFALATARAGGFDIRLAGLRFRSHSAMRPALIAAALAVAVGWLDRRRLAGLSAAAWGGMTAAGIDCSGLVHMSFRRLGRLVPRDADQQEEAGRERSEPEVGDLVTYGDDAADHIAFWVGEIGRAHV